MALYDFHGETEGELSLKAGQEILVYQTPEGGWWEGELQGRSGWFPEGFVEHTGRPMVRPRSIVSLLPPAEVGGDDDDDDTRDDIEAGEAEVKLADFNKNQTSTAIYHVSTHWTSCVLLGCWEALLF